MLKLSTKEQKPLAILLGLIVGVFGGVVALTIPLEGWTRNKVDPNTSVTRANLGDLAPEQLEQLAVDVLSRLSENRRALTTTVPLPVSDSSNESQKTRVHAGMKNARRLLPIARQLTIGSLAELTKKSDLSKERRLIASVTRIALDSKLGGSAEVCEDDLSVIHVGTEYAGYLTSDDEVMLLLGHELTHVAVRSGRLSRYIDEIGERVRRTAHIENNEQQKEELACDFTGAEVLRVFIATHPNNEKSADRFSRVFGYESRSERLTRAWIDFCAAYNGDPGDQEHLNEQQTIRSLLALDPELISLIHADAIAADICRVTP